MSEAGQKLIEVLQDRLYASLTSGPLMSCRPHSSRQRVDLMQLAKLNGPTPKGVLASLLGKERSAKLIANDSGAAPATNGNGNGNASLGQDELRGLFAKLRAIAEDAKTYEEDTGTQALFLGFPLLNVPPESGIGGVRSGKRILAPLAFIPLSVTIKATRPASVTLSAIGEGADLVVPNAALVAWVERMTGKQVGELFADDEGQDPWRELNSIVTALATALDLPAPPPFAPDGDLTATPRSDAEDSKTTGILTSAVIGLFPAANQGLLSDFEALRAGAPAVGPIESFLKAGTELGVRRNETAPDTATSLAGSERCVSNVDPCQARAVHLARRVNGLVIHGPPGTGKSQTITNIIGDHLANGERVLFVCDKRTALDVVSYRLESLGLGGLCAVVHDARRDQRDLYRGLREQLDTLPDTMGTPSSVADVATVDKEIARIHGELTAFESALADRPAGVEPSLHELVGSWFGLRPPHALQTTAQIAGVALSDLVPFESQVKELVERGARAAYPTNPWREALQGELGTFLGRPFTEWQERLQRIQTAATKVDQLATKASPPFSAVGDARAEGQARRRLGEAAQLATQKASPELLARWIVVDAVKRNGAADEVQAALPYVEAVAASVDRELALAAPTPFAVPELMQWVGRLGSYLQIARKWYAFFLFGRRKAAREVVERLGLALSPENASRATRFFERMRARRLLEGVAEVLGATSPGISDAELTETVEQHVAVFRAVELLDKTAELKPTMSELRRTLAAPEEQGPCIADLLEADTRGAAIAELEDALRASELLRSEAQEAVARAARQGALTLPMVRGWVQELSTVEGLLRIEALLGGLAPALVPLLRQLLQRGANPEDAWVVVKKAALSGEISRRVQSAAVLQATDGDRVLSSHRRYRDLSARRRELNRDLAKHVWVSKQRERLLASTGTRLNSAGAEIRRRLVTRGERAMRVRQMIGAGVGIEGGDPLFDLRPVWMASPDVVAQLFPREAVFDVVIFDEASQCRLEEGLPVLLRAKRVVIAGDPQQLPPTRFFESGVAQSKEQEVEDEQGLFEAQQAEVEDLLGAALNLSVEQAYLDVHYRSSNSDLIEFSNQNFYESRLQAIPAHPSSRTALPPLRLVAVGGVYDNRTNAREALEVVKIVRKLLDDDAPPSIGIACFNLSQRDAIVEALDKSAAEDAEFGARLAAARARKGKASFEGLFVRNLENVQGDERDHMIISTTYGPDKQGRFYRRFGPLGQAGGGRRLNVLVTRARDKVHLVTSIPGEVYRSLAAPPAGTNPNGAWLLFSYLAYAEYLERAYAEAHQRAALAEGDEASSRVQPIKKPSDFAAALGVHLAAEHDTSSVVHWGNDGFCVDAALVHPERPEDVTIGVMCDGTRFDKAADRVQWDIFRTEVLEGQRWKLFRLWSPEFFRDPTGAIARLKKAVNEWLAEEAAQKKMAAAEKKSELRLLN